MNIKEELLVSSSPQINERSSTANIMWAVVICLLPAGIWGFYVFGIEALKTMVWSISAALVTEFLIALIFRKFTLFDGTAFLTGLLIGYNLPPVTPWYIPVSASIFAIAIIKWSFGGLGGNWMNPALAGRVFVFFSWAGRMNQWGMPKTMDTVYTSASFLPIAGTDVVSGASPLGIIQTGLQDFQGSAAGGADLLGQLNYPVSSMGMQITSWFQQNLGIKLPVYYVDAFMGNIPGSIGEVSAFLLILGAIYLIVRKIITLDIPVSYFLSFGILTWIFGGFRFGNGFFSGDVWFNIFTGGFVLGALYMATDMVTSPLTTRGRIIFGVGCGLLTFVIRFFGSFPEGVSLAIILMNIFVPLIDRYTGPKRFGMAGGSDE